MFLKQGIVTEKVPVADLDKILEVGEQFGNVVRADTLEELAEKLGTPGLVETVAAYNSYAAGEPDPFGKAPEMIHAIGEGPYVAVLSAGYYMEPAAAWISTRICRSSRKTGRPSKICTRSGRTAAAYCSHRRSPT
jgi:hypothetical protein